MKIKDYLAIAVIIGLISLLIFLIIASYQQVKADDNPNAAYIISFYTPASNAPMTYYTNQWSITSGTGIIRLNGYTYYNNETRAYEHNDHQLWLSGSFIITEK
jgi:hypothetical protein